MTVPNGTLYVRRYGVPVWSGNSPFEQQAKPFSEARWDVVREQQRDVGRSLQLPKIERDEMCRQLEYSGNLHGWVPARKTIPFEYDYGLMCREGQSV